jgi:hypothetical protein
MMFRLLVHEAVLNTNKVKFRPWPSGLQHCAVWQAMRNVVEGHNVSNIREEAKLGKGHNASNIREEAKLGKGHNASCIREEAKLGKG